ncbi:MAG: hypothetical protein J6D29_07030 [Solobacterium sp.]|nr:hypothetical protein [Solobacterium sp.]
MLSITGMILILIQFIIDGYALTRSPQEFLSILDVLSFFFFGLMGVLLLAVDRYWLRHIIEKMRKKLEV